MLTRKASFITHHSAKYDIGLIFIFLSWTLFPVLLSQIDHYAQRDLKKGLQLFGTEGNVGLTNAWMIVQTDVRVTPEGVVEIQERKYKNGSFFDVFLCFRHSLQSSWCFKKRRNSVVSITVHSILTSVPFSKSREAKYLVTSWDTHFNCIIHCDRAYCCYRQGFTICTSVNTFN